MYYGGDMGKVEIKNCPFCGAKPEFIKRKGDSFSLGKIQLRCVNIHCSVNPFIYFEKLDLIKLWNQRV
jgi:hypothetical protein